MSDLWDCDMDREEALFADCELTPLAPGTGPPYDSFCNPDRLGQAVRLEQVEAEKERGCRHHSRQQKHRELKPSR